MQICVGRERRNAAADPQEAASVSRRRRIFKITWETDSSFLYNMEISEEKEKLHLLLAAFRDQGGQNSPKWTL